MTHLLLHILRRFCLSLGELHHLVASLIRQQPPDACYNSDCNMSLPDFAALSMAYIVITLKLLYGIDGRTEELALLLICIIVCQQSVIYLAHYH